MLAYIEENKVWLFSGIGITIISAVIAALKYCIGSYMHKYRLKHTPLEKFLYSYEKDAYWPWEFSAIELDEKVLQNCAIKSHTLVLKKLRKEIRALDTVAWIDVDKFTQVNRIFGKECGDKIISTILGIISSVLEELEIHAKVFHAEKRDEFYIVGSNNIVDEWVIQIIISAIQRYDWSSIAPNIYITCSAGIAEYGNSAVDTLKRARVSLNLVKSKGGNGIGPKILTLHPYEVVNLQSS